MRLFVVVGWLLLLLPAAVTAQTLVSDDEAIAHRETYVAPLHAPAPEGTHDVVMVKVHISKSGVVTSALAVKGAVALRPAAIAAVRQWRYRPFDEGAVVAVILVDFEEKVAPAWLRQDSVVQSKYFPAFDACGKVLHQPDNAEAAAQTCDAMLAIAKTFPDESYRHLEVMDAYEYDGRAALQAQRPEDAEKLFDIAAELARKYMKVSDAEYAYVFFWRAAALQTQGKIAPALADYETSEKSMRLAIDNIQDLKKQYRATLRTMLQRHAMLLRQQHQPEAASELENEAETLSEL